MDAAKLDRETEELKHKKVSSSVGKTIAAGRTAKGWTMKEFATQCNEKPNVIQSYEQGKAVPDNAILGKMERKLGVKLRGKNIGDPLSAPKPAAGGGGGRPKKKK
jgi:putative transcription factor